MLAGVITTVYPHTMTPLRSRCGSSLRSQSDAADPASPPGVHRRMLDRIPCHMPVTAFGGGSAAALLRLQRSCLGSHVHRRQWSLGSSRQAVFMPASQAVQRMLGYGMLRRPPRTVLPRTVLMPQLSPQWRTDRGTGRHRMQRKLCLHPGASGLDGMSVFALTMCTRASVSCNCRQ